MGVLDRIPRPLRLIPGAASALIIANTLGLLRVDAGSAVYLAIAFIAAAAAGSMKLITRRRVKASTRSAEEAGWVSFEVEVMGDVAGASRFIDALKERAYSGSRYVFVSVLGGGIRSYLIVLDAPGFPAEVEAEIVKSLATAVGGVRLSRVNLNPELTVADLASTAYAASRASAPLVALRTREDGPASQGRVIAVIGERLDSSTPAPVGVTEEDIRGHVGIFGSTGTGKTTTASVLSCALAKAGFSVLIMDWHGEYDQRLPCAHSLVRPVSDPAPADPLALGEYDIIVEVISRALSLTPPQEYMVSTIIERGRPRSLAELYRMIESYHDDSRWDKEVRKALERKVGMLVKGRHAPAFTGSWSNPARPGHVTVVKLDEIRITLARRAYALFVLASEFIQRSAGSPGLDTVFVIDESHNLFNAPEAEFAGALLAESRKYGMYFVVITQSPASIPNTVLLNTNTKIIHALRSARDRDLIASTLSLPDRMIKWVTRLNKGEAILQSPSQPEPVVLRVKLG